MTDLGGQGEEESLDADEDAAPASKVIDVVTTNYLMRTTVDRRSYLKTLASQSFQPATSTDWKVVRDR